MNELKQKRETLKATDSKWTMEHVAGLMEVSIMTINRWENDHSKPHRSFSKKLLKIYDSELRKQVKP